MDTDVQSYVISHSDDAEYAGRIDVAAGSTGRRRWPEHVKAAIVLECFRDGISVAEVARRHSVSAPQLHAWRRAARDGLLPMPEDRALDFVPVVLDGGDEGTGDRNDPPGSLALECREVRISVPPGFDAGHLGRVISAIRNVPS